jgi:AcrR family transcriptional regulator
MSGRNADAAAAPDLENGRQHPGGRSARVREAVRRATLELLAEEGFRGVTLPAVARRAGVNKTTAYRRWSSPLELVQEALAEFEDLALPEIDTGSWEGEVEAFVHARLRLIRDPMAAGILRAVIGMGRSDATLAEWVDTFWKPREREWRSPVEHAIARGELDAAARDVPRVELVAGPLAAQPAGDRAPALPKRDRGAGLDDRSRCRGAPRPWRRGSLNGGSQA